MAGWTRHEGQAVALAIDNVDTDQLIPARFMSAPRSEGYGSFLLHDLRRDADGTLLRELPLNRHDGASVLVAGRNFGSGSSREAAVYALVDAGFRAVVAPGFGDIFAANAVNNGLLPARVAGDAVDALIDALGAETLPARIDLPQRRLTIGTQTLQFALDWAWREKLVNGWDDIDLTLRHSGRIAEDRRRRRAARPWAWPNAAE